MNDKKIKLGVPNQEGQLSMMFTRGGPREGAGRKGFGETRKVSLTLSKETWDEIENRCSILDCSRSEVLRNIIESCITKM
ncbi:hypothetical protein GC102_32985 [Paenibacillus sp. LMG 31460]|uniref:Ribbon-helix-helix protein CopG domain-containing protein n=1 Tax=Paenibacillus germinis TaxID=2654979 RepID=A0ABX1ZDE3_9BACL|nr:hypothetical protein [Paenibacillus germinis]NOU90519.1 hypothetical protein [Paenibacillus germinis]